MACVETVQICVGHELEVVIQGSTICFLHFFRQVFEEGAPLGSWAHLRYKVGANLFLLEGSEKQTCVATKLHIIHGRFWLNVREEVASFVLVDFYDFAIRGEKFLRLRVELNLIYRQAVVVLDFVDRDWVTQIVQKHFAFLGSNRNLHTLAGLKTECCNFLALTL